MEIKPYTQDKFDECVEIFNSNLDKYFADYELAEFKSFLTRVAHRSSYFVLLENHVVLACGGYEKDQDEIILTWGMVKREFKGFRGTDQL